MHWDLYCIALDNWALEIHSKHYNHLLKELVMLRYGIFGYIYEFEKKGWYVYPNEKTTRVEYI